MILQYFSSHALFWCSPSILFFNSFPNLVLHSSSWFWAPRGGLLENGIIKSGKPSAYYLISGSCSGFVDKFYYQSCTFKFFFTEKEMISLELNSTNHEERRRFLKPLDFCKKAKLVSHLDFTGFGYFT